MVKHKKKRNKVYRGKDAALATPAVTRISAVNRGKLAQWWFEKKRVAKPLIITSSVVVAIILLVLEIIHVASGS